MTIIYPIRIRTEEDKVVEIYSPHLRINLIEDYLHNAKREDVSLNELSIRNIKTIISDYITWVQENNYILRLPDASSHEVLYQNVDHWINIEIEYSDSPALFERIGKISGVSLFILTLGMSEFFFVLAARLNKVSYFSLILPIITDFTMAGIVYSFSGAADNIAQKGKEFDNWFYKNGFSPKEQKIEKEVHNIISSWYLAKVILTALPIASTIFGSFAHWQGLMSMRDKFVVSNENDPIITPRFIYYLAIASTAINAVYMLVQLSSFSLRVTPTLSKAIDSIWTKIIKCEINKKEDKAYSEVSLVEQSDDRIETKIIEKKSLLVSTSHSNEVKEDFENESKIYFVKEIIYKNILINDINLLIAVRDLYGPRVLDKFLTLGEDSEIAEILLGSIRNYGIEYTINTFFTLSLTFDANDICDKESINPSISHNFFFKTTKGREFIDYVTNNFDKNSLNLIISLGEEQSIAEQILLEIEIQGPDRVAYTLLGKEPQVTGTTDNLKNVLGQDELNQLRIVPNGVLNSWSNKAYQSIADYIDNLAKSLDDMLSMGKSGNQVTITIALLEEWLGFATSGKRFVGVIPPYYNPNDDWPNGGGGSSSLVRCNSSSDSNSNEFTSLILPLYNGTTDYGIVDHM